MSSPASDAGPVPGSSNLVVPALSPLVLALVLHGLVCLIVTVCLSLPRPPASCACADAVPDSVGSPP